MSDAALATPIRLTDLWCAMTVRDRPAAPTPPDVGAIAAAAEAQGYERGRGEAEAALIPERASLEAATAALTAACSIDTDALRPLFVELVTRAATAVIGGELRLSSAAVERLVATALAAIENEGETVVHLCPEHAARLGATADPDLAPGEVRIETPRQVVSTSLASRLAAVVAELA